MAPTNLKQAKPDFGCLQKRKIIPPSSRPWASPLHKISKKTGDWRPCGDYRGLTYVTVLDRYPIPHRYNFTMKPFEITIYSMTDLTQAYHQIPEEHKDIPKTVGLFEFTSMPFILRNPAQTFQMCIDPAICSLSGRYPHCLKRRIQAGANSLDTVEEFGRF